MKCWIFHDWKSVESWGCRTDGFYEPCMIGFECRKCGRRKIKCAHIFAGPAFGPYSDAVHWMKSEVNK